MNRLFSNLTWRRGTRVWHRLSRWPLSERMLADYGDECVERVISVLTHLQASPVLREDPNGTSALLRVRWSRRHLRRMARAGVLTRPAISEAAVHHRPTPSKEAEVA